jgi:hypothetical protein
MAEIPSGYFPDLSVQWDIEIEDEFATQVLTTLGGREQRRTVGDPEGFLVWRASSSLLTNAQLQTVRAFFRSKRGRYGAFYFFDPSPTSVSAYPIGSVAASSTFLVPGKATAFSQVTVGGSPVSFTINVGAGPGGEDVINFGTSRTGAVAVTGTWRQRFVCRFLNDSLPRNYAAVADVRSVVAIGIKEVR